ncbi:hypothetical protein [Photorhabdus sp. RM96S]|uniref:CdiA C-terminal domain-containing protein n=1 Tax=Photorhabdus sp. RM96S TaxID=3342822 RepID=UPI0036DE9521
MIAASAEMATAGRVALEGCKTNPALCLNNVGIFVADAVAPEAAVGTGVLAAGTVKVLGNTKEGAKDLAEGLSHASNPLLKNAKPDNDAVASLIENEKLYAGKGATQAGKDAGSLTGYPAKISPNASTEQIRSLTRENESAKILAQNGYHVEQNPKVIGDKNPDYKINGEIFDNYAPSSSSVRNIWSEVKGKVDEGQTKNVVINISDTKVTLNDLKNQFSKYPINGLDKIIVIDKLGKPIKLK